MQDGEHSVAATEKRLRSWACSHWDRPLQAKGLSVYSVSYLDLMTRGQLDGLLEGRGCRFWCLDHEMLLVEMLERYGIPETLIWTEERSRSTHENALYGAEVLRRHGIDTIALVVEAQSMLRAEASFRKQGITVAPAASDYREWGTLSEELMPSWKAIQRNEITLHETLGLAWYWMRGWI